MGRFINHLLSKNSLLIIAGAMMHASALGFGLFYTAWICLVPLFVFTYTLKGKRAFYSGAAYGFVFACLALFWLPVTVLSLTQGTIAKALLTGLLAFGTYTVYYGAIIWFFSYLKRPGRNAYADALLIAAIWTISDFLMSSLSNGMPWYSMCIGNALLGNLYAIQPAEYGGISLLGFAVVFINYLFAHFFTAKQWKKMTIPAGAIIVYMTAGYLILSNFRLHYAPSGEPVKVALLSGNIPNSVPWNAENGNTLIKGLLQLNDEALRTQPDIVLWPESVVPWTYRPDDDFIKAILKSTALLPATYHIIGMGTSLSKNELYNSAYCFLPDGSIAGRYDKHYLVSMAEEPIRLLSWTLLKKNEEAYFKTGNGGNAITTSKGKIGVLICNEVFVSRAARASVQEGAEFLVSLASDAPVAMALGVVNQQFFRSRLRAVEVRKDIAVSCNMGISGMIAATGEILHSDRQEGGSTSSVVLTPNTMEPKSPHLSMITIYFSAIIILVFFYFLTFKINFS